MTFGEEHSMLRRHRFFARKSGGKTHKGCALDLPLQFFRKTVLYAPGKVMPTDFCIYSFRFCFLLRLAAAAVVIGEMFVEQL